MFLLIPELHVFCGLDSKTDTNVFACIQLQASSPECCGDKKEGGRAEEDESAWKQSLILSLLYFVGFVFKRKLLWASKITGCACIGK